MDDKNLFSIGEIVKTIGITRKIILNYEKKGLIRPDVKEGKTGNRYYTIDTFTRIRTIRTFQKLGLSLDEIRDYFDDKIDLQPFIERLEKLRDELNSNIERLYGKDKSKSKQDIQNHSGGADRLLQNIPHSERWGANRYFERDCFGSDA